MTDTLLANQNLTVTDCCVCGTVFAVPERLLNNRRQKGGDFYCPNGHTLTYTKTEVQRLQEQLDRAETRRRSTIEQLEAADRQRNAAERSNAALRGAATKLRKRIAAGLCPCCQQSFQDLSRHMAGQHPEYVEDGDRG